MKNNNINHGILPKKCRIFASMKSKIIIAILTLCICSCQYKSTHTSYGSPQNQVVKGTKLIGTTPVKDQGKSPLCWAYAMLATIESEHIMQGDSVNLSVAYVARMMLQEKAIEYYFSKGTKPISMRGMAPMLIHYINKYGAVPYDSYEDKKDIDMRVLCRKVEFLCRNAIAQQVGIEELKNRLNQLLDTNMGYMPAKTVYMLGAEYTPKEFANSVCFPGEYVALTSFTHHPFGEKFALETPDNQTDEKFLNVPIDQLMQYIRHAITNGHPVCWEGDISEEGFRHPQHGFVDVPTSQLPTTQASRQREFERLRTTDDHVMEIIGMFSKNHRNYYVCRNSWGKRWGEAGHIYLSEDYLRLKTIDVVISKEALK